MTALLTFEQQKADGGRRLGSSSPKRPTRGSQGMAPVQWHAADLHVSRACSTRERRRRLSRATHVSGQREQTGQGKDCWAKACVGWRSDAARLGQLAPWLGAARRKQLGSRRKEPSYGESRRRTGRRKGNREKRRRQLLQLAPEPHVQRLSRRDAQRHGFPRTRAAHVRRRRGLSMLALVSWGKAHSLRGRATSARARRVIWAGGRASKGAAFVRTYTYTYML